ncbi:MAG: hypothetical protein ACR2NZ_16975 [Rubripirellula sp.]
MSTVTDSSIKATCECGKRYLVRASLAGKRGQCECGKTFVVPAGAPSVLCSDCNSAIPPGEHFCAFCSTALAEQSGQPEWNKPGGYAAEQAAVKAKKRKKKKQKRRKRPVKPVTPAASHPPLWEKAGGDLPAPEPAWWQNSIFKAITIVALVTLLVSSVWQTTLNGPEFLQLYFFVGLMCVVGIVVARTTSCSTLAGVIVMVLTFELLGLARYGYGLSHGMSRFGMLSTMMLFGPIGAFALGFAESSGSSGGSGFFSGGCSSSCGSSCGGGCGGGGCGGCGG